LPGEFIVNRSAALVEIGDGIAVRQLIDAYPAGARA
jgi:hypothetical protein